MGKVSSTEVLHQLAGRFAAGLAAAGGVVLALVVLLTCLSIVGRALVPLGLGAIPGDVELVEVAVGFSVFCFFPWCQHRDAHARVDLIERMLSPRVAWALNLFSDALMLITSIVIASTLFQGMLDKLEFRETTFILRLPLWPGYALCMVGAIAAVIVAGLCFLRTLTAYSKVGKRAGS